MPEVVPSTENEPGFVLLTPPAGLIDLVEDSAQVTGIRPSRRGSPSALRCGHDFPRVPGAAEAVPAG